jgi:hypothetical protein
MGAAENDHVVQALTADRSDQSLDVRILPWSGWGADNFSDAHAGYAAPERVAVNRIAVSQEPSRRGILREKLQ